MQNTNITTQSNESSSIGPEPKEVNSDTDIDTHWLIENYWSHISKDYEFVNIIGQGTFGVVAKAWHGASNQFVAIKIIKNVFDGDDLYSAKKTLGEIQILRKLSAMRENVYTTKLFDIIIPEIESDTKK